jgi:hypothetical protein
MYVSDEHVALIFRVEERNHSESRCQAELSPETDFPRPVRTALSQKTELFSDRDTETQADGLIERLFA